MTAFLTEFYALVTDKKPTIFLIKARTRDELKPKIDEAFWAAKGAAAKGSKFDFGDFTKDKKIVKVTIQAC